MKYIKNNIRFEKYRHNLLRYLLRRKDIKEFYKEFKENYPEIKKKKCKNKENEEIIKNFYFKILDDLYNEKVTDEDFKIE